MKQVYRWSGAAFILLLLSGCFLPNTERAENQVPYPDQLASVQAAVDQFQQDTGVLPINTFDETTNLYQRYVVDFRQLVPSYMQSPPGTSFENGGTHQFVLVNVEEDPEVKVVDVTVMNTINRLNQRINDYRRKHDYAPIKEALDYNLFSLDYKKLGYSEEPLINSLIMIRFCRFYLRMKAISLLTTSLIYWSNSSQGVTYEEGIDLRPQLYEESPYVPLFSVPYTYHPDEGVQYDTRFYDENE
ncbi:LOW QUALITY PROTEIN: ABC transporter periplasmic binding protein YphF [Bacillus sp. JCM 19045]|nr:LOW QUALITY PROTEIN: ABC transporter periplasmic binding protein YphF [Bacillus sp. JCM 19045]